MKKAVPMPPKLKPTAKPAAKPATAAEDLLALLTTLEAWLAHSSLEELELEQDGRRLRLKKPFLGGMASGANGVIGGASGGVPAPAVAALAPVAAPVAEPANTFKSPLVGTFYAASGPEVAPFVQVGTEVQPGQVLGIIEAMKTMNQLTADQAGRITQILVKNGQAVEFGQPLFVLA